MRYTFTAVITPEDGKCYVRVPDITGCATTGKDVEDAVAQITDALSGVWWCGRTRASLSPRPLRRKTSSMTRRTCSP